MGKTKRRKSFACLSSLNNSFTLLNLLRGGAPSSSSRLPSPRPQWIKSGSTPNPDFGLTLCSAWPAKQAPSIRLYIESVGSIMFAKEDRDLKEITTTVSCPFSPTGSACLTLQFRFFRKMNVEQIARKILSGPISFLAYADCGQAYQSSNGQEWIVPMVVDPDTLVWG